MDEKLSQNLGTQILLTFQLTSAPTAKHSASAFKGKTSLELKIMAVQVQDNAASAKFVALMMLGFKLESNEDEQEEFKKTLESVVAWAIPKEDEPFDAELAMKCSDKQGSFQDECNIHELKIANKFFKTNNMQIDQVMHSLIDQDNYDSTERQPKFRGLYSDSTFGLICKDTKRKSWKIDIYCSHEK